MAFLSRVPLNPSSSENCLGPRGILLPSRDHSWVLCLSPGSQDLSLPSVLDDCLPLMWPIHGDMDQPHIPGQLRTKSDLDFILAGAWRGVLDGHGGTSPPHCAGLGSQTCSNLIGRWRQTTNHGSGRVWLEKRSVPQEAYELLSHRPPF